MSKAGVVVYHWPEHDVPKRLVFPDGSTYEDRGLDTAGHESSFVLKGAYRGSVDSLAAKYARNRVASFDRVVRTAVTAKTDAMDDIMLQSKSDALMLEARSVCDTYSRSALCRPLAEESWYRIRKAVCECYGPEGWPHDALRAMVLLDHGRSQDRISSGVGDER